jgi:hypothetical protein
MCGQNMEAVDTFSYLGVTSENKEAGRNMGNY